MDQAIKKYYFMASLLLAFLFWGWTMVFGYFFSDDFTWLWHGQKIAGNLEKIFTYRWFGFYSPVMNLFYAVFYHGFGYGSGVYYLFGVLIHGLISFFTGILAYKLTDNKMAGGLALALAAIAGTAFEPLVWISANIHLVAAFFILSTVLSYWQYLTTAKRTYAFLTILTYLLAILTKEIAITGFALLILVYVLHWFKTKNHNFNSVHFALILLIVSMTAVYGWVEYLWQSQGGVVNSGLWQIGLASLLKIPLILFNEFIPIELLINGQTSIVLSLTAIFFWLGAAYYFRKSPVFWFGLFWLLITILPTVFFQSDHWWQPLPSRYTYLPRLGVIIILANYLAQASQLYQKRVYRLVIIFMFLLAAGQGSFAYYRVQKEYPYVFQTGRSLRAAVAEIEKISAPLKRIYISLDRPFGNNHSHIVGAFATISRYREKDLVFLGQKEAKVLMAEGEAYLYWAAKEKKYRFDLSEAGQSPLDKNGFF
jgi:hypothetical protein